MQQGSAQLNWTQQLECSKRELTFQLEMAQKNPAQVGPRRHLYQMPEPPQVAEHRAASLLQAP